jgi:hypothetical protein
MGMVRGYGLELLVGIIKLARPTIPIQIQHTRADANFPHIITSSLVNEYKYPETDSDRIPCGFRAPHSDRSDETIKGKQSEFYMAVSNFSDQISALEQLAILKFDFFRYLYI